jgi:hypothetical protein
MAGPWKDGDDIPSIQFFDKNSVAVTSIGRAAKMGMPRWGGIIVEIVSVKRYFSHVVSA